MIIVDRALRERAESGRPVRVGMVGAGFMGSGIARQILTAVPGMQLVAIANRHGGRAREAYRAAGAEHIVEVGTPEDLGAAVSQGISAVTEDPFLLCRSPDIDALIEVTGTVEHAAAVVCEAIDHGKHVVLMNAELDGTIGPELKARADAAGVVLTGCDGDQPGVQMNLHRFVRGIGITPLVCGNIKGLHDPNRNPTTQQGFAERWGQNVRMVTSFADGTKISFEQAIVANATGMRVARRGMTGHTFDGHVDEATCLYDVDELRELGGVVDYLVGTSPGPGVFVYGAIDDPRQQHYLELYKLGTGPLYSFYTPYHLCHFEVPLSVARAVLLDDAVIAPLGPPMVEVITVAKIDLAAGDVLDGFGGYASYGQCENADVTRAQRLLPMGLSEGCRLRRAVSQGEAITYEDVTVPPGRLADALRADQDARFPAPAAG